MKKKRRLGHGELNIIVFEVMKKNEKRLIRNETIFSFHDKSMSTFFLSFFQRLPLSLIRIFLSPNLIRHIRKGEC